MFRKISALLLAASLIAPLCAKAMPYEEYMQGRGTYQATEYTLSPGLTYTEVLSSNAKYGYEQSYVFRYTPSSETEIRAVYGESVYGTNALGTLIEKLEQDGSRVVGGINGDFYGMSTGIPLGMMIVDGEIVTSDNERSALGFDKEGNAFISYPNMQTVLSDGTSTVSIDHINKGPTEYGVYLLTDTYSKTTTSKSPSVELVLQPYETVNEYKTEEDLPSELSDNALVFLYSEESTDSTDFDNATELHETDGADRAGEDKTNSASNPSDEAFASEITKNFVEAEGTDRTDDLTDSKNPNETEKSEGPESSDTAEPPYYARVYEISKEKLHIGCEIPVVVKEIRRDSENSDVPTGCFVVVAENVNQAYRLENLYTGQELTLSVTAEPEWYDAVTAIGNSGGFILKNGAYCDDVEMNHYPYANPRTAVGITEDGTVVFYCVDGRKNEKSGGMRIDQLSHEMKNLGCITAMNLDGGGSTTVYAALPGEKQASLKNIPSDGRERKTANSLVFLNTAGRNGGIAYCELPEQNAYVLAGGSSYVLNPPIATDENRYPVDLPLDFEYEYFLKSDESENDTDTETLEENTTDRKPQIVDGSIFLSGSASGNVDIYVRTYSADGEKEYLAGSVYILDTPQSYSLPDEIETSSYESTTLSFSAKYHTVDLHTDIGSVLWAEYLPEQTAGEEETDPEEPTENTAVDLSTLNYQTIPYGGFLETDSVILSHDGTLSVKIPDKEIYLAAKLGNSYQTIIVHSLPYPFVDSADHWAAKTLYDANRYGLMQGEPSEEGTIFSPDRNMSKTEFLITLARMLYPDIDDEVEIQSEIDEIFESEHDTGETTESMNTAESNESEEFAFADASDIPEWALKYYKRLNSGGLLSFITDFDENGVGLMKPNDPITRRQVLIMLGALCEESETDFIGVFTDTEYLQDDRYHNFINNAIAAEIFLGYTDGTLKPENFLTRAEAATVIVRFCEEHRL